MEKKRENCYYWTGKTCMDKTNVRHYKILTECNACNCNNFEKKTTIGECLAKFRFPNPYALRKIMNEIMEEKIKENSRPLTLEEIKEKKKEFENSIEQQLIDFEKETGCRINKIDTEWYGAETMSGKKLTNYIVETFISINP
jgi:hypothetical protein